MGGWSVFLLNRVWILFSHAALPHFLGDFVVMTTRFTRAFSASVVRITQKEFDTVNTGEL